MSHPLSHKYPIPIPQLCLVNTDVPAGVGAPPLDTTEDSSPCNSTPMNRAHVLGVSVGEAQRAFVRVQRRLHGITTEAEVHMATYSLFACTDHRRQVAHRQYEF